MSAHSKLIRNLISEIRTLREQLAEADTSEPEESYNSHYTEMARERQAQEARNREYRQQEELREARNRANDYEDAVSSLKRAQGRGDDYAIDKAMQRLKRL